MASRQGPTIRQKRLGSELRKLREEAKVSQKEAGEHIDGGQGKLSKIETGRQRIRRLELLALLDLFQVHDSALRDTLLTLLRDGRQKGWWHQYDDALNADTREMVSLEAECDRIIHYSNMIVPGLLQTPNYAAAMISGLEPHLPEEEVKFCVDLRMDRQEVFARDSPPQFICVLDEALLRRPVGGTGVMVEQLQKLIRLSRPPKLVIQVVPLSQAVYAGVHGSFRALFHSSTSTLDVVEVSNWTGSLYMQEEAHVETYRLLFDEIRSAALSSRDSMTLISRIARDLENG